MIDSIRLQMQNVFECLNLTANFSTIEGYLHPAEGYALMLLAQQGPGIGEVVELGSFKGLSTCWLATGAKSNQREKITAIDHFQGSPEHQNGAHNVDQDVVAQGTTFPVFMRNLRTAGVDDFVHPIQGSSEEVAATWNKPIRLLFIDAGHEYESVRRDFDLWSPFVIPGGCIAFHDVCSDWPGVLQCYQEILEQETAWHQEFVVSTLGIMQRADA